MKTVTGTGPQKAHWKGLSEAVMEAWHVAGGTQIQSLGESRMKLDRGLLIFISRLRQVPCTQWGLTADTDGHGMTLRVSL